MTGEPAFDAQVRAALYRLFLELGEAPSVAQAAEATGATATDVTGALERLAAGRALVLHPGTHDVWMLNPLSAVATDFTVHLRDDAAERSFFANCGWDALGIAAMLATDADIDTSCGDCGEPLRVPVRDGVAAGGFALGIGVPARSWWDDIGYT